MTSSRVQLFGDRLSGLGVARGRISRFPIDLRRRPYNTFALQCECVMLKRGGTTAHEHPAYPGPKRAALE